MKKFDPNLSLGQYKTKESFWYFDELSEEERILAYRLGWEIFDQSKMFFADFSSFHKRKGFILQSLGYSIAAVLFLSVFFIILVHPSDLKYAFGGFVLAGSLMTFIVIMGKARKNLRETQRFFNYIDPIDKPENFKAFQSLQLNDDEGAETFYSNLRKGNDYQEEQIEIVEYDKTVSLLAIEFLIGNLGELNDLKQKALQQDPELTSGGFDKVVSSVMGGTDRGVRDYFSKISNEILTTKKLSSKRKEQLFKVREIFVKAGLREKAVSIDDFIQERTNL
ncbi:hypothetical protein SYJ56_04485 [Algoriphagus sp. D3-2-R+10]|uniref:hypothetical protein n=1 Tax=Algoriphagus aurantiacus TaxID=3103948 RepID=UPI002B3A6393|nr:hypothetical protein [Algoriphagus sp. D3-2-R+10]MEB2774549.1 hypothetical protein [Algoriphagus sp. D3-2-R+10]